MQCNIYERILPHEDRNRATKSESKWEMSVYLSDCLKFRLKSFYENRQLP